MGIIPRYILGAFCGVGEITGCSYKGLYRYFYFISQIAKNKRQPSNSKYGSFYQSSGRIWI
jgi:hypothetical protein